jgi:hypothetical protein
MNTTKTVKFEEYELTIGIANAESGMYRTLLIEQAQAEEAANIAADFASDLKSLSRRLLHTILYPSMIAAVKEQKGFAEWPIPFDEFRELPEPFMIEWEQAVFSLNGHWQPKLPEEPAKVQKKATKRSPE